MGLDAIEQAGNARAAFIGNQRDAMATAHQLCRQCVRGDHMTPGTARREGEVANDAHRPFHRTV
jgi:hypothetical protein